MPRTSNASSRWWRGWRPLKSSSEPDATRQPVLNIIVVPEDGGASRTYRLSRGRLRLIMAGAAAVAAVLALLVGSWWYLALRSAEVPRLEARLAELEAERDEIAAFADVLDELEARYEGLRGLLGAGDEPSGLWLPPPDAGRTASAEGSEDAPTAWPLGDRGFVTQSLLEEGVGAHPGIDIAVPVDTYVRAAGSGVVAEVGEDPVYGFYVALEHGQGYSSLYAHASLTFVELGQTVRRGEVIALSGSTGRSTAPHLHFEIQRGGEAVDPLTLVRPPA